MSERERWIVYPLLFFALGAALRDKILQQVEAKEIICESLKVVNQDDPAVLLAELGTTRTPNPKPGEPPRRAGFVLLRDDLNAHVSELRADQFLGNRVACNQMYVLDPVNRIPLVIAGTEPTPGFAFGGQDPPITHQGVIYLNNQRLGIRLAPPAAKRSTQPPAAP